jgi:hypothetical protein
MSAKTDAMKKALRLQLVKVLEEKKRKQMFDSSYKVFKKYQQDLSLESSLVPIQR